jgi:transketolase
MGLHKTKKSKEMVSKLKRPPTEWEKIFATYTSEKGLISRIHRGIKKLNSPELNEPIKKWKAELNRTLSKEEIQMAKKHMKKCSPSLATKEMQIKTTLRFHLTPIRIAIIKNIINNMCWQGCREKGNLAVGNASWCNHCGKNLEAF